MVYGVLRDKEFTFDVILLIWHQHDLKPFYPKSKMAAIAFFNTIFTIWVDCAAL